MILASVLCVGVGLSLGLLGGGGSVLMVPVFIYTAGLDVKEAITLSLLVVSVTSLIGAFRYFKQGFINLRLVLIFAVFGSAGAVGGARWTHLMRHDLLLLIFAALMILIGFAFLLKREAAENDALKKCRPLFIPAAAVSILLGILTGFLGVGGGFLIVPALSVMMKCSMKSSIGTSLAVISTNALAGFAGHVFTETVDWKAAGIFSLTAGLGAVIGSFSAQRLSSAFLKRGFAILIIGTGLFVLIQNLGIYGR